MPDAWSSEVKFQSHATNSFVHPLVWLRPDTNIVILEIFYYF